MVFKRLLLFLKVLEKIARTYNIVVKFYVSKKTQFLKLVDQ